MAAVVLDLGAFRATYPELETLTDEQILVDWTMATGLCDNTDASPIADEDYRKVCLNALAAHFAILNGQNAQGAARSGLVGRISSAGQGSVNVSVDMPSNPNAAWYMQTQYGATFWQLTTQIRMALYVPGPRRNMDPFRPW
jgi:hypothetical protein